MYVKSACSDFNCDVVKCTTYSPGYRLSALNGVDSAVHAHRAHVRQLDKVQAL